MKILFFFFVTLGFCGNLLAFQGGTPGNNTGDRITGTIRDEDGLPMINVTVSIKGSARATTTTSTGEFAIRVQPGDVLVFSFIGMERKEIKVEKQTSLSVVLSKSDKSLDEVVVEGYGSAKKVGSVVGSVSQINGKLLQDKPVADVFDALAGKVPGLMVLSSSGEPGSQASLSLNGVGSLSADVTPLMILDGIPVQQSTILAMNPNDFDNITVLRDASATSIYGSRAANGVIYFTSKKGKAGVPVISLHTQYAVSALTDVKFFNSFMNTKELTGFWVATGYKTQGAVDTLLQQYPNDTRWYKYFYKDKPPSYQTDLSLSGGAGKTTYYISGSYYNGQGLAYHSNYDRYTFRANVASKITDWLNFGFNLAGGYNWNQTNPFGTNNENRGLLFFSQPFYSPIDPATGREYPNLIPGYNRYNPHYRADQVPNPQNTVQLNPMGFLELTPIKGLTIKSQGGLDAYDFRNTSIQLPSFLGSPNNGNVYEGFARYVTRTVNNTAEYHFKVAQQHDFTALVGQEYIDNQLSSFNGSSSGQTDDRLLLLNDGPNTIKTNSFKSEYTYISYFGRLEYNFAEKYYANVSARQDQSSLFGAAHRTANFGSVGVMWKAKREDFLTDVDWLTDLVLRVNTGTSGNSAINYSPTSDSYNYASLATVGTSQYNSNTGWNISTPGNPDLTWEKVRQTTIGAEFSLFNRARFDISVYDKVTSSMLVSVPYPYTTGFSSITANVGSLQNKGINATINFDVYKSKKGRITPYINLGYNQERVTKLFQGLNYWIVPNTGVCWVIGKPISYFEPIYAKVDPQTGNPTWYNPNQDPSKIVVTHKDPKDVTSAFSSDGLQQNTGIRLDPPLTGGFGVDATYGGFALGAYFNFVGNKYIINNDEYFYSNPTVFPGYNQSKDILNYWKKPGDVTKFPAYGNQFTQFDSRIIENAAFIRLKTVTLSYNVPQRALQSTKVIKGISIVLTGRNLLTFTKYPGVDPEVNSNLELGSYPNTKQYAMGLNVQF
jgi:TonB-linked SusC/RagA family outer membrane protein